MRAPDGGNVSMAHYLVIVESPAKVKTIKKFLGKNYTVAASNGHVRDLPKSQLGIDVEHDFEPKYITIRGKGEILANLRKEAKKADKVYLATDPDREGEAISWHLAAALKLDEKKMRRITFNEITKNAVKASLKTPRDIDMDLVDAQQARRVLDRMVGYRISPLLWAKVKRGLSAGRVQSVALRIIADREEEINAFIPEEYWSLDAILKVKGEKRPLTAKFYGTEKKKMTIHSKEELDEILQALEKETYEVKDIKKGERIRRAPLPFTTSTLQQEAAKVLNFGTQKTMRIAQQLYEGIDVKGSGTIGVITQYNKSGPHTCQNFTGSEFLSIHFPRFLLYPCPHLTLISLHTALNHLRFSAASAMKCLIQFFCKRSHIQYPASDHITETMLLISAKCCTDPFAMIQNKIHQNPQLFSLQIIRKHNHILRLPGQPFCTNGKHVSL